MGCTAILTEARFRAWRHDAMRDEQRRIPDVLRTLYDFDNHIDGIDRRLKAFDETSWLWFDGYDSLLSLRAILDAVPHAKIITLDVGDLIHAGWIIADEEVCARKTRIVGKRGQPAGPTIILAEGKSDIALLKASLARFHPDLVEFVTFLDHSEFKVDGGPYRGAGAKDGARPD